MKVQDIMTKQVASCTPDTNLSAAAMLMWNSDCGVIPVVSAEAKTTGVITDRDICMAVATKHRKAEEITVGEVMTGQLQCCSPKDTVKTALELMRTHKIRRLPVVDAEGKLQGVLSINDVVLVATDVKGKDAPSYEEIARTFKSICEHQVGITAAAA